jgi:hypothetical protein
MMARQIAARGSLCAGAGWPAVLVALRWRTSDPRNKPLAPHSNAIDATI